MTLEMSKYSLSLKCLHFEQDAVEYVLANVNSENLSISSLKLNTKYIRRQKY